MILSMNNQMSLFLISALFGFAVGFFYYWINVFIKIVKHHKLFIQLEDFLYWTVSALFLFFIMLKENFGEIRGFLIFGTFIGMLLYFLILSNIFLKVSDRVLLFLKRVLTFVFKILFLPLFSVYSIFKKLFFWIFKKFAGKKKDKKID